MLAHSYMSSKCDVSAIMAQFPEVPLESFVLKAAQKAFTKVVGEQDLTVTRVNYSLESTDKNSFNNMNEMRVGEISSQLEKGSAAS
jgi:hypothetical protein